MKFKKAREIILIIERQGYSALMVGGAVRDLVMHRPVTDIDLATDMPMDQLAGIFVSRDIGKSKDFGMLNVEYRGEHFEVSGMSRRDACFDQNISADVKKWLLFGMDARRRDFTINAMAMDAQGLILDPLEGRTDIADKIIRTVRVPDEVFKADPLRLVRAVRFACALGFGIEPETLGAIRRLCPAISASAPERIGRELINLASLAGKTFAEGLSLMEETGLLEQILPEISRLRDFDHDPGHHPEGGVYGHTLAALRASENADPRINLSILFHDCGKPGTFDLKNGRPAYRRHERAAEAVILGAGQRLKLPARLVEVMCFVAANHMKGKRIGEMKPSRAFRLMTHPDWPVLKAAIWCDLQARSAQKAHSFERAVADIIQNLGQWMDRENRKARPVVTGRQVMEYTGLPQGPEVGRILEQVTSWAIDNHITDEQEIRKYVISCKPSAK